MRDDGFNLRFVDVRRALTRPAAGAGRRDLLERKLERNHRHDLRVEVTVCDVLVEGAESPPHQASVRNRSAGGIELRSPIECPIGSRLRIDTRISDGAMATGTVRTCRRIRDEMGARFRVGVQLD